VAKLSVAISALPDDGRACMLSPSITTLGHGPDLVLVHGWAMHGGIFAPLTEYLAGRFRVHLVDLPGHGHSRDFTAGDLHPPTLAKAIVAATPPSVWLGWSLGGLVALRAALDHSDRVLGLVEIAASPRFVRGDDWAHAVPATMFREFGDALIARFRPAIERFLALETLGSAHAQDELRALRQHVYERGEPLEAALHEGLALLDGCDYRDDLRTLDMPNLWIAGRRDRIVPPAAMRWAAAQSLRGNYLELAAGHAPFLSHAVEVADAIAAFTESITRA
jgi:pimeloyl-[acyl-carrier protein] methyl ester esterase